MAILDDDPVLLALMVGIITFVNAPVEEFLFRNIAQKRLGEVFTPTSAILLSSVLFTALHIQSCWVADPTLLTLGLPLTVLFVGSVGLGWLYEHTGDLSVAIGSHAFYNLLQFGVVFFSLVG